MSFSFHLVRNHCGVNPNGISANASTSTQKKISKLPFREQNIGFVQFFVKRRAPNASVPDDLYILTEIKHFRMTRTYVFAKN